MADNSTMAEGETVTANAIAKSEGTMITKSDQSPADVVPSKGGEGDLEIAKTAETPEINKPSTEITPSENGVKSTQSTESEEKPPVENEPESADTMKTTEEPAQAEAAPTNNVEQVENESGATKPVPSETEPTKAEASTQNIESTEISKTDVVAKTEAKRDQDGEDQVAQTEKPEVAKSGDVLESNEVTQAKDKTEVSELAKKNDVASGDEVNDASEVSEDKEVSNAKDEQEPTEVHKEAAQDEDNKTAKTAKAEKAAQGEDVKESLEKVEPKKTPAKGRGRRSGARSTSKPKKPQVSPPAEKKEEESERVEEDMDTEDAPLQLPKTPILGSLEGPVEIQTGKRNRRKVDRLSENISAATPTAAPEKKGISIPEGSGVRLGDCSAIEEVINRTKADELKPFHKILYGVPGKSPVEIKRNVRGFCGWTFAPEDPEYTKKITTITKTNLPVLKSWCAMLKLAVGGTKETIIERLMAFLMKPTDDSKQKKADTSVSRKRRSGSRKSKSAENVEDESEKEKESEKSSEEEEEEEKPPAKRRKVAETKKTPAKTTRATRASRTPTSAKGRGKRSAGKKAAEEEESEDGDAPPTDVVIRKQIEKILKSADLELITMKTVRQQIIDMYPEHDLTNRKEYIKATVKEILGA